MENARNQFLLGKSGKEVYRNGVINATNPLDSSEVPTKDQLKYIRRTLTKELLPYKDVSKYNTCFE